MLWLDLAGVARRRALARFLRALVRTNLTATVAARGTFVTQALFMIVNNLVFFVFWWVLLRRVPDVGGWHLHDVEALFGVTAASFGLVVAVAGGVRFLGQCIDEGELDALLTQPKPTLPYALGLRSQASGFGDMASGLTFLIASGHLTPVTAPAVALAIAASASTFLGTGIIFFSLPFWLGRTETLSRQLWELLLTFSLYPEPIFGGGVRLFLFTALPAGFVSYVPVQLVEHASLATASAAIAGSMAYLALGAWIFHRGLARYASGSRFVVLG
jgi:ABC-2 type transport system permease protein